MLTSLTDWLFAWHLSERRGLYDFHRLCLAKRESKIYLSSQDQRNLTRIITYSNHQRTESPQIIVWSMQYFDLLLNSRFWSINYKFSNILWANTDNCLITLDRRQQEVTEKSARLAAVLESDSSEADSHDWSDFLIKCREFTRENGESILIHFNRRGFTGISVWIR